MFLKCPFEMYPLSEILGGIELGAEGPSAYILTTSEKCHLQCLWFKDLRR